MGFVNDDEALSSCVSHYWSALKNKFRPTIYAEDLRVIREATIRRVHDTEVGYRMPSVQEKLGSLNILSD